MFFNDRVDTNEIHTLKKHNELLNSWETVDESQTKSRVSLSLKVNMNKEIFKGCL